MGKRQICLPTKIIKTMSPSKAQFDRFASNPFFLSLVFPRHWTQAFTPSSIPACLHDLRQLPLCSSIFTLISSSQEALPEHPISYRIQPPPSIPVPTPSVALSPYPSLLLTFYVIYLFIMVIFHDLSFPTRRSAAQGQNSVFLLVSSTPKSAPGP